tara:strand:- start:4953 stop:6464 length:1512 start_codon:yes stop_codon:yes gene_type:complete
MARAPIGMRIRERRRSLGRTQADLAQAAGISASYLNLIEHNKRQVGGALLRRLGEVLSVGIDYLDGAAERRLIQDLEEIATDPANADGEADPESATDLVARHRPWAGLIVNMHRTNLDQTATLHSLSDRLSQDPFLSDAVHGMLSNIAAIRSTSEILASVDDVPEDQRARFHRNLVEESAKLSDVAQAMAGYFDRAPSRQGSVTPAEEVDDFVLENQNYFAPLEKAVEELGARLGCDVVAPEFESAAHALLRQTSKTSPPAPDSTGPARPAATRRFQAARALVVSALAEVIEEILLQSPLLTSDAALVRGRRSLQSYAAAALLMPYDQFRETAIACRYDIDMLQYRFSASVEQVCHRLASLRKPGAEGVPFAFMRSDPAGYITKRLPLRDLPLPRYGGACPLWAIYRAFQTPDRVFRQLAEFPNRSRFLFFAKTVAKQATGFDAPRHLVSIMLGCDALYARDVIYGDGLDLTAKSVSEPVGSACRVCTREECRHRQEHPITGA